MANIRRNRHGSYGRCDRHDACTFYAIIRLFARNAVRVAFPHRHLCCTGDPHDSGVEPGKGKVSVGVRQWRTTVLGICSQQHQLDARDADRVLHCGVPRRQHGVHRIAVGGHWIPAVHVFPSVALLRTTGALFRNERTIRERILQRIGAVRYRPYHGHFSACSRSCSRSLFSVLCYDGTYDAYDPL